MVNLLPKTVWEASFWGRFFKWTMAGGRYIVILTELVVIAAFLSRFKLDRDYSDLKDRIDSKRALLISYAETERKFRQTQDRLEIAGKIIRNQLVAAPRIEEVTAKVPAGVFLTDLTVSNEEILVTGGADKVDGFGVFLSRLAGSKSWKGASVTKLVADGQAGIKFTISLLP